MTPSPLPPSGNRRGVPLWAQILVWIALLGLLIVLGIGLARVQQPVIAIGREVPDFTLPLYEGYEYEGLSEVRLSDLRGRVVLVNFWASWCKPCESEAADLEAAWRFYQPTGQVIFLGVDYVDTPLEGLSYLRKFDITYPNGPDMGSRISAIFNRQMGVPETYLIDPQGILRYLKIGPFASLAEIQAVIDPLLRR
jgi:cytochrome c biogenesis protein CcmG/thiol:disulfide interchange protein DsbE